MLLRESNKAGASSGGTFSRRRLIGTATVAALGLARVNLGDAQAASGRTGRQIARVALKYKGTHYVWGGNSPRGFDCSGFTQYVVRRVTGIDMGQGVPGQWKFGSRVAKGTWRPGDLVFFANTFERGLSHVGIYIGRNRFIHAENERTGVVISDIGSDYYASHYYGARRVG